TCPSGRRSRTSMETPAAPASAPAPPRAPRRRVRRAISTVLLVMLGIVVLALAFILLVANTPWGREQVRTRVVTLLDEQLAGRFHIGRLEGNLLTGVRLVDVSITDTTGSRFLQADTM